MYIKEKFKDEVEALLKKEGIKKEEMKLEKPPEGIEADLAFPCFILAKKMKKNPAEIAKDLRNKTSKKKFNLIKKVEALGPYLNFHIDEEKLKAEVINSILKENNDYGAGKKKKEKVMVEFSQPNTHKGFHIGHLRGTSLGDSLIRIMRFNGYTAIAANYPGDIGAHVAKCLWLYMKKYSGKELKTGKGKWLGEIYAEASKLLAENDKFKEEYEDVLKKMYAGDKKIIGLWKKTRQWSLDDFNEIYRQLGVKFDVFFFESEVEKKGKDFVMSALKKKIVRESEGAVIFDLQKYSLGVFIVLRSNETPLYATKDLALAAEKFNKYKIDKSIYVVGSEQKFYFQQLFKALELLGFKQAKNCFHLSYGLVMLKEGKMSSREGNVILYDELYKQAVSKAKEEIEKRKIVEKSRIEEIAKVIALGALKYAMLNKDNNKTIIFDWNEVLNFEGDSGPYLQYTYARANSILKKASKKKTAKIDFGLLKAESEIKLIKKLAEFKDVVESSANEMKPNIMADYTFELCSLFNEFYHQNKVIGSKEENERLKLVEATKIVLKNALSLLGIDAPEKM